MTGTSHPLPPHQPEEKPVYDCPNCQDTGVKSYWHDYGMLGAEISSEPCPCTEKAGTR